MKSPYWDVTITGRSDATVNGVPVEMVVPTNVYSSVFQHLATAARQAGRPVLARGVDETRGGRVSWFTVDADGQAAAGGRCGGRLSGGCLPLGIHREPRDPATPGLVHTAGEHGPTGLTRSCGEVLKNRRVDVGGNHHLDRCPIDSRITSTRNGDIPVG